MCDDYSQQQYFIFIYSIYFGNALYIFYFFGSYYNVRHSVFSEIMENELIYHNLKTCLNI